jgi:hypothetical protein
MPLASDNPVSFPSPYPVRYGFILQVLTAMFPLALVVKFQELIASLCQVRQFRRALICETN